MHFESLNGCCSSSSGRHAKGRGCGARMHGEHACVRAYVSRDGEFMLLDVLRTK